MRWTSAWTGVALGLVIFLAFSAAPTAAAGNTGATEETAHCGPGEIHIFHCLKEITGDIREKLAAPSDGPQAAGDGVQLGPSAGSAH